MRQLLIESGEINERIHSGDVFSAKAGLPKARKLCEHYSKILRAEDCEEVRIEPYVAYGGWSGITYSYFSGDEPFVGSVVGRTLA